MEIRTIILALRNLIGVSLHNIFCYSLLTSLLLLVVACSKSDDLQLVEEGIIIDNPSTDIDNSGTGNNTLPEESATPNNPEYKIIYTDIQPDFKSEMLRDFYNIDLNNDGIIDFTIKSYEDAYQWAFEAEPNKNNNGINALVTVSGPFWSYTVPLNSNEVIYNILKFPYYFDWTQSLLVLDFCDTFSIYCPYGWEGKVDKYLGLRFQINGQTHYGWARLDVLSTFKWTIKDYAYNAIHDQPILAGQKE